MMERVLAIIAATVCLILPRAGFADDGVKQIVGTWKLLTWVTATEGGEKIEPFGATPKGRLVLTEGGHWLIIVTRANRSLAKTSDEKAALLDSMLAYSGKYTINGDRIITRVDMTWNEVFSGALQTQTRLFSIEGERLIIRTGLIPSSIRPGQRADSILVWEREH
jgi:hypothetical protein